MTPYFSIVIPVYNAAAYLRRCVDSILAQTFSDFELILVDDGSADESAALCDGYAAADSRVLALHQANAGPTPARRRGLDAARGAYICFADADDWVVPRWLEAIHGLIRDNGGPDMVLFDYERDVGPVAQPMLAEEGYYDRGRLEREIFPYMLMDLRRKPFGTQLFPGYLWSKVFRRELICQHYLKDDRITIFEDTAMTYQCVYNASAVYITREKLYVYRKQTQSNLNHYRPAYFMECKLVKDCLRENLGGRDPALDRQINAFCAYRLIHGLVMECVAHPVLAQAAENAGRTLDESRFAADLTVRGLPLYMKPFVLLVKHRLYRAAVLLIKLRMDR